MKKIYKWALALLCLGSTQSSSAQSEVMVYTNMGEFTLLMYDTIVPITAGNFIDLASAGYYDGVIFHRVIDNFMIQGGDPTGTGSGGPGYSIDDEFDPRMSNVQKTISMANSGPNTGGSQFFINLVNNTYLDYNQSPTSSKHPVFGVVIDNFSVVQAIGDVAVDGNDRPVNTVVMDSVRVVNRFVGIAEQAMVSGALKVYPNPISSQSKIELFSKGSEKAEVKVYSVLGAMVFQKQIQLASGNNSISLKDIASVNLPFGEYILTVRSKTTIYEGKLMLQ